MPLDRRPTPGGVGIRIPAVTPAPVASAAIGTVGADIITGVTTVAAITTGAGGGMSRGGSIREVLSLDMRPGPIVPSNISSRAPSFWDGVHANGLSRASWSARTAQALANQPSDAIGIKPS